METTKMIEILKQGGIRVIDESQTVFEISHTCNDTVIYFWHAGFYTSYNKENTQNFTDLLNRLERIIRIEKNFNSEYFPIWTKEDGEIIQGEKFVKLNGRYYTISFLEDLIDKIREFKRINI